MYQVLYGIWKGKVVQCDESNFMSGNVSIEIESFGVKAMIQQ